MIGDSVTWPVVRRRAAAAGALAAAVALPLLAWSPVGALPPGPPLPVMPMGWWGAAMLLPAHGLAALLGQRGLCWRPGGVPAAWSYRGGFLISAGLALGLWGSVQRAPAAEAPPWLLGWALAGAALGGLLATMRDDGLYEVSFVPSPAMQAEVRQRHMAWLGTPAREPLSKRIFDMTVAAVAVALSAPFWLVCILLIWLEDPGPIFFIKNSIGKGGVNFQQLKFRTMIRNAEAETGPIPARENDDRVLLIGRLLRKTNLDELPQLINILRGEMSFVGPRPLRTVVVRDFLDLMPQWAERHAVRPGIAGVAQVIGGYYTTPLQKLRFDRIYIRHIGVGFDIKLLATALAIAFWLRWQKDWNGRVPRHWLRFASPSARRQAARQRTGAGRLAGGA